MLSEILKGLPLLVGIVVFLVFCGCIAAILISQDRGQAGRPKGDVTMPASRFYDMVEELDRTRRDVVRLRMGMRALIDNWPGAFTPAELAEAQALIAETEEEVGFEPSRG
ncbi:MAG TPA: hypothetical protein VJ549_00595 [Geothrix sp.]|nr:hypothetical protein [Geothrix sp.]HJV47746.1 hypothetical protein [Geothrix sp.]